MPTHLTVDIIAGIFLAASPLLFRFADQVYLPHLIVGLLSIGSGLFTETTPHDQGLRNQDMRHAH